MDPQEEIRNRMRERELSSGRDRAPRRERSSGGVKSEKNDEAAKQFEEERRAWKEKNAAKMGLSSSDSNGHRVALADADEEDKQIAKAHDLQQQNRESLANSLRMAREAADVGQDTLIKLTTQKEQMKKMDEDLDQTNESLTRSDRVIRGMKSTIGGLKNWFSKPKEHQSEKLGNVKAQVTADLESEARQQKAAGGTKSALFAKGHQATADPSLTPEQQEEARKRAIPLKDRDLSKESDKVRDALTEIKTNQDVEDSQLDELGELLGTLKGQAKDMNTELRQQAIYVDHLDDQLVKTGVRVKKADNNVKQIS